MATTLIRLPTSRFLLMILCGLLYGAGAATAQDWNPFSRDERRARPSGPTDPGGLRPGDRPLEPGGSGRDAATDPPPGPPAARGGDRWSRPPEPRGAAPMAVERGELAPVEVPPERTAPPSRAAGTEPPRFDGGPPPRETPSGPGWSPHLQPRPRSEPPRDLGPPQAPQGFGRANRSAPPPPAAAMSLDRLAAIDARELEDIVAGLELPSRSPTIAAIWPRIWTEAGRAGPVSPAFEGIRLETLRRSGAVAALKEVLAGQPPPNEPILAIISLRARLVVGDRETGCAMASQAIRARAKLPASFRRDAVLAAGYCAMAGGNGEAAKLTADLIRGEKIDAPFALAVLGGAGARGKPAPPLPKQIGVLDYRIGEASGLVWPRELADRAEPALLAVLASEPGLDPGLRVVVAERAARLGLVKPDILAEQYRAIPHPAGELSHPLATSQTEAMRRSLLLQAAEQEPAAERKARAIAALMEDAGRSGLRVTIAAMLGPVVERMQPGPDTAWFAEIAAEILVHAGRGDAAHAWIDASRGNAEAWRGLAALVDSNPLAVRAGLAHVERLALAGQLDPPLMHRLVTVLDALDIQVPIPLWEAASRTPQPTDGHLPATGVLAALKSAREQRDGAQVILRSAQALGPADPSEVNLLALGDVVRALKGSGYEREARAVGIEALAAAWPRSRRY